MITLNRKYSRILHVFYWATATLFLTYFFGHYERLYRYTLLYVLFQLPVAITTTYLINYWLVPKYLFRGQTGRFIYMLAACLVISAWLNALITIFAFVALYHYNAEFLPPASFDFKLLTAGLYLVILLGVAIHFTRESLLQQRRAFEIRQKQMETEMSLNETRLKLLQGQMHPHMLFNSLNTIYGLSLKQSDKTPGLILNLSDMLDYMLYQCDHEKIALDKEFEFLKNYIEIEKQRFSPGLDLNVEFPEGTGRARIAPLLLLPLVENCFKHTRHIQDTGPVIDIKSELNGNLFRLSTRNTCRRKDPPANPEGIGLKNLKERLALLYPGRHELNISIQNDQYIAELKLELETKKNELK
jgi:sensor histidine kinase YesM